MLDAREKGDLPRLAGLDEDVLGVVALLGGEDGVDFRGGDGERAADGGEFLVGDEGRVCDEADLDAVFVVADDVLWWVSLSGCDGMGW